MNKDLFHPDLRHLGDSALSYRSGWFNFMFPESMRINWYGDCRLYCTADLYQDILDRFPCKTEVDSNGTRYCALKGKDLDIWREPIKAWSSSS